MRELELSFADALKNGLSPETSIPIDAEVLRECLGFRCGRAGLEGARELSNPLPTLIDMHYNWPFPQFLKGKFVNILVVRDNILQADVVYSISEDHSIFTHLFTVDQLSFGTGSVMEMADFGEFVFLANGAVNIYREPTTGNWVAETGTATIPLMRTVCNFNGQLVGGGIESNWYDCDSTFIVWSKIGDVGFVPDRHNESGYRRDLFGGEVLHVRKLGKMVVVYSTNGVSAMFPVKEPAATFGFDEISDSGLLNSGAMCSSTDCKKHIYVDSDYTLHMITSDGDKELGYQEFMERLSDEDIIVNYDPLTKDFYIGNSSTTFLLSPFGMTEVRQHPSGVWRGDSESHMVPATIDDSQPYLKLWPFSMGFRGMKTIFTVEASLLCAIGPEVAIEWANAATGYQTTDFVPMNDQGIATLIINGTDFSLILRFDSIYEGCKINYIKVRYKMTDLRSIRGVYAPPPRGQTYAD